MSKIVVLGAGICGLAAGILLRRDGHDVTVLERDPEAPPDSLEEAWEQWSRGGVTQFRQAHFLVSRGRILLEETLPDVLAALKAAGGVAFDPASVLPPSIADRAPRDGDERFRTVTARRPTLEHVFARAAESEPGLEIRRGVSVATLIARTVDGTPHVVGVRTDAGEQFHADLIVDAMGRRSDLPRRLEEIGAKPMHEESEDSGFIYYTRFFRSPTGAVPEFRAPVSTAIGAFSVLTLPSENDTWSVTVFTSSGDRALKRLRDADPWTALIGACPLDAHWIDGEPLTDIMPMGGVIDRRRRLIVDGEPVATGIALLGDACACTNPALGRGITMGLLHTRQLRNVLRDHGEHPRAFADAWDAATEAELMPWYHDTVEDDRAWIEQIETLRDGREVQPPRDSIPGLKAILLAVAPHDPDAFRAIVKPELPRPQPGHLRGRQLHRADPRHRAAHRPATAPGAEPRSDPRAARRYAGAGLTASG